MPVMRTAIFWSSRRSLTKTIMSLRCSIRISSFTRCLSFRRRRRAISASSPFILGRHPIWIPRQLVPSLRLQWGRNSQSCQMRPRYEIWSANVDKLLISGALVCGIGLMCAWWSCNPREDSARARSDEGGVLQSGPPTSVDEETADDFASSVSEDDEEAAARVHRIRKGSAAELLAMLRGMLAMGSVAGA